MRDGIYRGNTKNKHHEWVSFRTDSFIKEFLAERLAKLKRGKKSRFHLSIYHRGIVATKEDEA